MQLQNVNFQYKTMTILNKISFTVPPGKIIGIIGENGCGKTTLLQLMAGILVPSAGAITLDGEPVTRHLATKIAYQPDIDLFYESFTGREVFTYYSEQFDDFSLEKAYDIAAFLEVPTKVKLKKLSKGNRGRIKMACALAREAQIYLLDEPFSGLDPLARESLMKALIRFIDPESSSIVLSTHEVSEVEPILDEIILMKDGRIRAMDNLERIRDERGEGAVQWMKSLYGKQV